MATPAASPTPKAPVSLAAATVTFVFVTMVCLAVVSGIIFAQRSDRLLDDALDRAVRLRTAAAGTFIAKSLQADYADLSYLAEVMADEDDLTRRGVLTGLRGDGSRISWVGFAAPDGTVQFASDGLLEGASVSERPWFRNGLQSGFAGDVHEAVLLAQKLQPEGGEPLRFVDLARPVISDTGDVAGVVGMHINFDWLTEMVTEAGRDLDVDLFLLSASGEIIVAPDGMMTSETVAAVQRTAAVGERSSGRVIWPDGRSYFTTLVPSVGYEDLPSFGWRLAGRIDSETFQPGFDSLRATAFLVASAALAILAVITVLFVLVVLNPISRLTATAEMISRGKEDFPQETRTTREAARLSAALARLQTLSRSDP